MSIKETCIDRVLPNEVNLPHDTRVISGNSRAVMVFNKMWVNGATLQIRFIGGTDEQKAIVIEQAGWWSEHANLTFEFNDAKKAHIRISFDPDDGAWSYIGTDANSIPQNEATMNLGFLDRGTAAHEFGHAIGLAHEHQNPKAGIDWNEAVVIKELGGPPNNWSEETTKHNVLDKYSVDQIRGTNFDEDSIMLYFFADSWVKNRQGTKANEHLSASDIAFIGSKDAYPKK